LAVVIGFSARAGAESPEVQTGEPTTGAPTGPSTGDPSADASRPADAPTIGDPGHWSISLDRLFGFDYMKETTSVSGVDTQTSSSTSFSFFGSPSLLVSSIFGFPRAGVDVFVAPGLSVGTALAVIHGSQDQTPTGGMTTNVSFVGLMAAPRIGYVARLAPSISFWPRAGVSIYYIKLDSSPGGLSETLHFFAATVEAPLVFTVAPRAAFTFGPTLDVTFSGGATIDQPSSYGGTAGGDARVLEIGAQAGFVVTL
jgi:hypothetical protein